MLPEPEDGDANKAPSKAAKKQTQGTPGSSRPPLPRQQGSRQQGAKRKKDKADEDDEKEDDEQDDKQPADESTYSPPSPSHLENTKAIQTDNVDLVNTIHVFKTQINEAKKDMTKFVRVPRRIGSAPWRMRPS